MYQASHLRWQSSFSACPPGRAAAILRLMLGLLLGMSAGGGAAVAQQSSGESEQAALADDGEPGLIGREVFWKPTAQPRLRSHRVDLEQIPFPGKVGRVDGEWLWLGQGWLRKSDVLSTKEALEHYDQLVEQQSSHPLAYYRRGIVRIYNDDLTGAAADFTKCLQLDPAGKITASAYTGRGFVRLRQRRWDEGLKDCNQAISLNPRFALAYNNRGLIWADQQQWDNAVKDYSAALYLSPTLVMAHNNRGLALASRGDFEAALKDYNTALRLDPYLASAYNNRGLVWAAKGDSAAAINDYNTALRLDPALALAYNNRAQTLVAEGQVAAALLDFDKAIFFDPELAWAYNNRGSTIAAQGDSARALDDFTTAIKLDDRLGQAFNNAAWLLATCSDAALRDGRRAVKLATRHCELTQWQDGHALDTLAAAHAEAGDFAAAVEWQEKALALVGEADQAACRERLELYRQQQAFRQPPVEPMTRSDR